MKCSGVRQYHLQSWYFWYLVVFVLLISIAGNGVTSTFQRILQSPMGMFADCGQMLPLTSHFFLSYALMQPVTHAMNLTRYINLMKFCVVKQVCSKSRARELSEPEDQDYYGIGSRSARFSIMLIIGIVFGTICPLMYVVVGVNFFVCRLVYGYLIPYAESRKNDSGGHHWAAQLRNVQHGVLIYIVMMVGTLMQRAESPYPAYVCSVSFVWWILSYRKFTRQFCWEKLAFTQTLEAPTVQRDCGFPKYFQKEFSSDPDEWYPEGKYTRGKQARRDSRLPGLGQSAAPKRPLIRPLQVLD